MNFVIAGHALTISLIDGFLIGLVALMAILLFKAQKTPDTFDLRDLLLDTDTKRISGTKTAQMVALLVSTWGFVALTLDNNLSEWYFGSYMAVWAVRDGFRSWMNRKVPQVPDTIASTDQTNQ